MKIITPKLWLCLLLLTSLFLFNSCQKDDLAPDKTNSTITQEFPNANTVVENHVPQAFSPKSDCYAPQDLESAIVNIQNHYYTRGNTEEHFFPVVSNMFGEPIWEAYWRFEDEETVGSTVTIVPLVKGEKQSTESLLIFYETNGQILTTSIFRRNEMDVAMNRSDLEDRDVEGLNAMEEMFTEFDAAIFCGDASLRCGPRCKPGLFAKIKRWFQTNGTLFWMTLWSGQSGGGVSVPFAFVFDFGGIDNSWFYILIASFGSDNGSGNYGPPPPTVFEQPESLARLCELIDDEANGDFYDIDPNTINDILLETEVVSEFCDIYGNIFYCDIFSESEIESLVNLYNNGNAPIIEEISDYLESQGCGITEEEKECLLGYADMAGSFDLGLKKFQIKICSFLDTYDLELADLENAETDFNDCLPTSSVEECLKDDPDPYSDCASWNYIPVGPPANNPNYQSCAVTGIHIDFNTMFLNNQGKWEIAHVDYTFGTFYFEFPRIRKDDEGIAITYTSGQAAIISAKLVDKVQEFLEEHFWGKQPPTAADLEAKYFTFLNTEFTYFGGRVTVNPHYGTVPNQPYTTRHFHNGNCF